MKSILSLLLMVSVLSLGPAGLAGADITLTPITSNAHPDAFPRIAGNHIIWQAHVDGNWEIFLHHIPTGVTEQITENTFDDIRPRICGNYAVWQGHGNLFGQGPSADWEIFLYDISTQETIQITTNDDQDHSPEIGGEWVAWMAHTGHAGHGNRAQEIFLFHLPGGPPFQLADSGADNVIVQMDGNSLLWAQTHDAEASSLFVCDLTQDPPESNPAPDDYVWDGGSPRRDGDLSVFAQYTAEGEEIFLRQGRTRQVHRVTDNSIRDEQPCISGQRIVWTRGEGSAREIHLAVYRCLLCLRPADSAVLSGQQPPTFAWEAVGYDEFKVEFSPTESFQAGSTYSLPFRTSVWLGDASFTPNRWQWRFIRSSTGRGESLYWRVKGRDAQGIETLSEQRSFSFETRGQRPRLR